MSQKSISLHETVWLQQNIMVWWKQSWKLLHLSLWVRTSDCYNYFFFLIARDCHRSYTWAGAAGAGVATLIQSSPRAEHHSLHQLQAEQCRWDHAQETPPGIFPKSDTWGAMAGSAGAPSRPECGAVKVVKSRGERREAMAKVTNLFLPEPFATFTEVRGQAPIDFRDSRDRLWALHRPRCTSTCTCLDRSSMVPTPHLLARGLGTWWPAASKKCKKLHVSNHHWVWAGGNESTHLQGGV